MAYDIDKYLSTLTKEIQTQLKTLLNVFEDYTFFFNASFKKFTKMSFEEKQKYLESWANSNNEFKTTSYNTLKMFVMMFFYSKKEILEKIGYNISNHCN